MAKLSTFIKQTHGAKLQGSETVASLLSKHKKQTESSVSKYVEYINSLSLDELHRHSVEAGEVPINDKTKLLSRLEKRFTKTLGKQATAKTDSEFTVAD